MRLYVLLMQDGVGVRQSDACPEYQELPSAGTLAHTDDHGRVVAGWMD